MESWPNLMGPQLPKTRKDVSFQAILPPLALLLSNCLLLAGEVEYSNRHHRLMDSRFGKGPASIRRRINRLPVFRRAMGDIGVFFDE